MSCGSIAVTMPVRGYWIWKKFPRQPDRAAHPPYRNRSTSTGLRIIPPKGATFWTDFGAIRTVSVRPEWWYTRRRCPDTFCQCGVWTGEYWDTECIQNLHNLCSIIPINLSPVTIELDLALENTASSLEFESRSPAIEFKFRRLWSRQVLVATCKTMVKYLHQY